MRKSQNCIMLNIRKMRFDNSPIMSNTQISLPLQRFRSGFATPFFVAGRDSVLPVPQRACLTSSVRQACLLLWIFLGRGKISIVEKLKSFEKITLCNADLRYIEVCWSYTTRIIVIWFIIIAVIRSFSY